MRFLKLIRNSKPKNTEDINTIEILEVNNIENIKTNFTASFDS